MPSSPSHPDATLRVAKPPDRPVLVYDGECTFCCYWIRRWERITGAAVEYRRLQDPEIAARFPEIPRAELERAVHFIDTYGRVTRGAAAVFRSLSCTAEWRWPLTLYCRFPALAALSETLYAFVAQRRTAFSWATRFLWGVHSSPPEYQLVRRLFLRGLGLVYLVAFWSLWLQVDGLYGRQGVLPAAEFIQGAAQYFDQQQIGWDRYRLLPTWAWINTSDAALHALCGGGMALSILLAAGLAPALSAAVLWMSYLSLVSVGREFLSFQWDALLLETGFLAIFLAPLQLRLSSARSTAAPRLVLFLFRWLLFRLMFESGCVKLLSGDVTWRNLTALSYHYETQPLPTALAWYAHHLPAGVQQACVGAMFGIELALPLFIFAPRRPRIAAAAGFVLLQSWILLTGNYAFFNYLTLLLCVPLLDDEAVRRWLPSRLQRPPPGLPARSQRHWLTIPLAAFTVVISLQQITAMFGGAYKSSNPIIALGRWLAPFRIINSYGLFAVMTTTRPEIILEGSNDGRTWAPFEFKYKPGDVKRRPAFVAPHQPRLDWQMWFAALGNYRENPWLVQLCERLLEGSPPVLRLLRHNPFPDAPPKQVRAVLYLYHFSSRHERTTEGAWWTRERAGIYLPPFSLPTGRGRDSGLP